MVDDEDYDYLNQWRWHFSHGYAMRRQSNPRKYIYMHREIMGIADKNGKIQIDHIDRNGLNNRRSNLRICSRRENRGNQKINSNNKSGYRGVCFDKTIKGNLKWRARISAKHNEIFLGRFTNSEDAARAWDTAAKKYFGDFARLNFPTTEERMEYYLDHVTR